ncbi:hypothetical protein BGP78_05725 [Pseudoalteromonas sp. MSK9-3]|uniref:M12 family metallo-peptidase n=1 Tax=Pseudoalteromonas sp. MSK9-3 TaxID=1897633 RepID=UPI000E6B8D93|nr:M12 family metallo-peptidase [Pseudoalteromonas sp. MSK9-3]RJE78188.1 hypothetical protein BGP78_05725 [Pseudoalteromonas sp. MSK9-3]
MNKMTLALLCSGCFFTQTALADYSISRVVEMISGGEQVQYTVTNNPFNELTLQSTSYAVALPNGTELMLEFTSSELHDTSGALFLRDEFGDTRGTISISRKGKTQGIINTPHESFHLFSQDNKLIVMESKLPSGLSEESELEFMAGAKKSKGLLSLPAQLSDLKTVTPTKQQTLRLSLYYTNDVKKFLDTIGVGPKEYLEFYIDSTNQAYKNSGVNVRIEIANITAVDYDESNASISAVEFFLSKGENLKRLFPSYDFIWDNDAMDEELKESAKYGSDMDMLITNLLEQYCGVAQVIGAEKRAQSMAVTNIHCLQINTLPHEIGHLFGAEHNWEATAEIPYIAQYAHGYYDAEDWSFRTIMSYSCVRTAGGPKECPIINYFSTPLREFNGKYIGTAHEYDNVRQHNEWAPLLTNFSNGADCKQFDSWTLDKTYQKGDEISHNGMLYRANWWSYNDNPAVTSSKSEWKEVWQTVTSCQ